MALEADYEKTYTDFWKGIVENPDGTLNLDQIKRELSDYAVAMGEVAQVYDELTRGRFSKPNTAAGWIIDAAAEVFDANLAEDMKDAYEELAAEIDDLDQPEFVDQFVSQDWRDGFSEAVARALKVVKQRLPDEAASGETPSTAGTTVEEALADD